MRAITARHSLAPRSPIHLPNSSPRGSPAIASHSRTTGVGGQLDLPRSRSCRPEYSRACPVSACLSPGSARDDVPPALTEATGCPPFWSGPISRFGPTVITRFINSSHLLRIWNLPSLHAALRLAASLPIPSPGWGVLRKRHRSQSSTRDRYQSRMSR